eukprot:TRINITY_DN89625_c0_g1_i1.p1 TRINITY_DN89625_c0_g1~~TRINITY_DN89625_c0_g1_i1.p1  ORF type:complete len:266 (-),score=44.98 TRINITY_DN89625_c0_g1_i1:46-843(-)
MYTEDPWGDPGQAGNVIYHLPAGSSSARPGPPSYKEYVSLQEWEALKDGLSAEPLPVKRNQLSDYIAPVLPKAIDIEEQAIAASTSSLPDEESQGKPPPRRRTPRRTDPMVDGLGAWLEAKEKAVMSPRQIGISGAAGYYYPLSPRRHGASSTQAAAKMICASPRYSEVAKSADALNGLQLQVRTVTPTAFAPQRKGPAGKKAQVKSRDTARYPSGNVMRPARMSNFENRKRLTGVLGNADKIDAKELHPSKAFNVVPMTNLRIA